MKSNKYNIYSKNDIYQELKALISNKKKRNKKNMFIIEGVRNINNAVASKWEIEGVVYCENYSRSKWAKSFIYNSHLDKYNLSYELLSELSNKDKPSEILIILKMKKFELIIDEYEAPIYVLLDRPSNYGNLGTIIRSCDAFGVKGIFIYGHSVDMYNPEVISATTGSYFSLPIYRISSRDRLESVLNTFRSKYKNIQIIGTSAKGDTLISNMYNNKPRLLIIGNETNGINDYLRSISDLIITIPMNGYASSLNVACATTVLLYEFTKK